MDYHKIYTDLVGRCQQRVIDLYTETHHIIPRCLGGSDEISNLVKMTPEEHYVAHQLLVKMYPGNSKLALACRRMTKTKSRKVSNRKEFGWIRRRANLAIRDIQRGSIRSESHLAALHLGKRSNTLSEETKLKMSKAQSVRVKWTPKSTKPRPIRQLDSEGRTVNTFPSLMDASRSVNGSASNIKYAAEGKFKMAYGFKWAWLDIDQKQAHNTPMPISQDDCESCKL